MAKIVLNNLNNLNNQHSATTTINNNNDAIETAFLNTLSRDGTTPNEMLNSLDMNSNRILNLPAPIGDTEPVRKIDLDGVSNSTVTLDDLTDVILTTPANNDTLLFNGTNWVNHPEGGGGGDNTAEYLVKTADATLTSERVVTDTSSVTWDWATSGQAKASRAALTGDVTASANSNATTIANDAVTFAKMQNVATDSLLGRDTAGTGDVENITLNSTLAMSGSGALQRAALTGDVTSPAGSNVTTIPNDTITLAKMANIASGSVLGRVSAGTGDPETLVGSQVGGLIAINDLSDVTTASKVSGDLLQWNGSAWVNNTVSSFGAPSSADYLVKTANTGLSAERVVTDTASITWDWSTPGQVTAAVVGTPLDTELAALATVTSAADKVPYFTGSGTADVTTVTSFARTLLDDTDAATMRTTLGVLSSGSSQPLDAELTALAGLTSAADKVPYFTGSGTAAVTDLTSTARSLIDDTSTSAMRTTLGVAIGTDVQAYDAQLASTLRQNSKSADYTTILTDGGKHILHPSADTTARNFTIDSNANVAYPIGTTLTFVNQHSGGVITIKITTDTMRLAGAGTTGDRTLAADGIATALKITSTEWIISGTGLT